MGFRVSYLLTKATLDDVNDALGTTIESTTDDWPDADVELWATTLSAGDWLLVCSENELFFFNREQDLKALSRRFETLSCIVNETVMAASTFGWNTNGSYWWVHHQGDAGDVFGLDVEGAPPAPFDRLLADLNEKKTEQGEPAFDYAFEVPVELVRAVSGYRYDQVVTREAHGSIHQLSVRSRPSLLARLFGGRS